MSSSSFNALPDFYGIWFHFDGCRRFHVAGWRIISTQGHESAGVFSCWRRRFAVEAAMFTIRRCSDAANMACSALAVLALFAQFFTGLFQFPER